MDLQLEVVYPIEYIAKAIAQDHPARENIVTTCRQLLLYGDMWPLFLEEALVDHPRVLAFVLFEQAIQFRK